jgi:hypothetical protein
MLGIRLLMVVTIANALFLLSELALNVIGTILQ